MKFLNFHHTKSSKRLSWRLMMRIRGLIEITSNHYKTQSCKTSKQTSILQASFFKPQEKTEVAKELLQKFENEKREREEAIANILSAKDELLKQLEQQREIEVELKLSFVEQLNFLRGWGEPRLVGGFVVSLVLPGVAFLNVQFHVVSSRVAILTVVAGEAVELKTKI